MPSTGRRFHDGERGPAQCGLVELCPYSDWSPLRTSRRGQVEIHVITYIILNTNCLFPI